MILMKNTADAKNWDFFYIEPGVHGFRYGRVIAQCGIDETDFVRIVRIILDDDKNRTETYQRVFTDNEYVRDIDINRRMPVRRKISAPAEYKYIWYGGASYSGERIGADSYPDLRDGMQKVLSVIIPPPEDMLEKLVLSYANAIKTSHSILQGLQSQMKDPTVWEASPGDNPLSVPGFPDAKLYEKITKEMEK